MNYFHFTNFDPAPIDQVLTAPLPAALAAYDAGDKQPLNDMQIATTDPFRRIGGWCFDLRPYLKKYWVKTKYYGILEYYAVNKTAIRKELKSYALKIVEIEGDCT